MDWPANANGFDTNNGFGLILPHAITGLRLVDEFRWDIESYSALFTRPKPSMSYCHWTITMICTKAGDDRGIIVGPVINLKIIIDHNVISSTSTFIFKIDQPNYEVNYRSNRTPLQCHRTRLRP